MNYRELIKDKKKIVVKIGSSSITHESTGNINYRKLEKLVRILCDIKNQGKDVVLVSSGAIAVGRQTVGIKRSNVLAEKQACAAIGQCRLMMTYQKLFSEYNQVAAQVLLTKYTMQNHESVVNAKNTFEELFKLDAIPVVNENDTVSTYEIEFGDNDKLSALVKCIEERSMGNQDFLKAEETTLQSILDMKLPEVNFFVEHFIQAYGLTLDESK